MNNKNDASSSDDEEQQIVHAKQPMFFRRMPPEELAKIFSSAKAISRGLPENFNELSYHPRQEEPDPEVSMMVDDLGSDFDNDDDSDGYDPEEHGDVALRTKAERDAPRAKKGRRKINAILLINRHVRDYHNRLRDEYAERRIQELIRKIKPDELPESARLFKRTLTLGTRRKRDWDPYVDIFGLLTDKEDTDLEKRAQMLDNWKSGARAILAAEPVYRNDIYEEFEVLGEEILEKEETQVRAMEEEMRALEAEIAAERMRNVRVAQAQAVQEGVPYVGRRPGRPALTEEQRAAKNVPTEDEIRAAAAARQRKRRAKNPTKTKAGAREETFNDIIRR